MFTSGSPLGVPERSFPRNGRRHWPSGLPRWPQAFGAIKWLEQRAFGHFGRSIDDDESQKQGALKISDEQKPFFIEFWIFFFLDLLLAYELIHF